MRSHNRISLSDPSVFTIPLQLLDQEFDVLGAIPILDEEICMGCGTDAESEFNN